MIDASMALLRNIFRGSYYEIEYEVEHDAF